MQEDVQWFLAKLMSFEPSERPSALDAWRTFIAFAATTAGPELASWASDVVAGGGERRAVGRQPTIAPEPLGNPTRLPGPMPTPMAFSETNEVLFQPYNTLSSSKPPRGVGGGTATAYWKPEQLAAMSQGREDAPKPSRKEPEPSAPLEFEEVQTPLAVPTATLSADEKGGLFLEYVVAGASVDQLDFSRANLRGARLDGADLSGATLDRADLREASLRGASLTGTVLARSNLVRADLRRASLEKADLHNAHLLEANLEEASLYQANLSRADVVGANLSATNLRGVDLSTTQVRFAQITPETYRKSKWTFEELAELHERGASIGGLADELARAAKPGLTLYFRTGLSDLDHAAVLVLLHEFKVLHPDSDLRLAEFENTGTRARLNIRGSNEDHLALVAEWLQQRPWEPPSQTRPSSSNELVPLDTRPFAGPNAEQISFVWDRTGRMELWRRVSNRLVRLKTYNNDPPSALLLHYRLLVTAFTPSELERLVPLHRADVALEVNFSGSSKAVASQVASVMERCVVSLDWFRVLMTERPLLAGQIAFVAATYGFQDMGLIETAQAR
ncbi:MAG: pentapeptide repeat-containing protein [Myxococcota bacterium]